MRKPLIIAASMGVTAIALVAAGFKSGLISKNGDRVIPAGLCPGMDKTSIKNSDTGDSVPSCCGQERPCCGRRQR